MDTIQNAEATAISIRQYIQELKGMESRRDRFQAYINRGKEAHIALGVMNRVNRKAKLEDSDLGDFNTAANAWKRLYNKRQAMLVWANLYGWWW